jgi:microsomal dipeptidase-like Zn-dependent dipeptidase
MTGDGNVMLTEGVKEYYSLTKKNEVREAAKKLRRKFLRYNDAEIVYSMSHKMLLEHASKAGAIYRMEGTVLINRDIFDEYLEQFREPSTLATRSEEGNIGL